MTCKLHANLEECTRAEQIHPGMGCVGCGAKRNFAVIDCIHYLDVVCCICGTVKRLMKDVHA
jgi:hypothetical protein